MVTTATILGGLTPPQARRQGVPAGHDVGGTAVVGALVVATSTWTPARTDHPTVARVAALGPTPFPVPVGPRQWQPPLQSLPRQLLPLVPPPPLP